MFGFWKLKKEMDEVKASVNDIYNELREFYMDVERLKTDINSLNIRLSSGDKLGKVIKKPTKENKKRSIAKNDYRNGMATRIIEFMSERADNMWTGSTREFIDDVGLVSHYRGFGKILKSISPILNENGVYVFINKSGRWNKKIKYLTVYMLPKAILRTEKENNTDD